MDWAPFLRTKVIVCRHFTYKCFLFLFTKKKKKKIWPSKRRDSFLINCQQEKPPVNCYKYKKTNVILFATFL